MARILVLEDDELVREFLCFSLSTAGHEVVELRNGAEASSIHSREPVDLVITDLFMPERDGLETISELRASSPQLPIIAISGGGGRPGLDADTLLAAARRLGACQVLEKPFGRRRLVSMVSEALTP
jgi:DNA-binding response OmpR family regulator